MPIIDESSDEDLDDEDYAPPVKKSKKNKQIKGNKFCPLQE